MSTKGITKGNTDNATMKSPAQSNFDPSKMFGSKLSIEQNPFENFNGTCSGTMINIEDIGGMNSFAHVQTDPDSHTLHQSNHGTESFDWVNVKVNKSYQCLQTNEFMNSNKSITLLQEIHQKRSMKGQESESQFTKLSKDWLEPGRHQSQMTTNCTDSPKFGNSPKFSDSVNDHLRVSGFANAQKVNCKKSFDDTETGTAQKKTNMS